MDWEDKGGQWDHTQLPLHIWALGSVFNVCVKNQVKKKPQHMPWRIFKKIETWEVESRLCAWWICETSRAARCIWQWKSTTGFNQYGKCNFWMKSEGTEGRKGRRSHFVVLAQSWSPGDTLVGICTLPTRGIVFPEEGNGDGAGCQRGQPEHSLSP